jgi:polysaccharide export outer membrane protein
MTTPFKALGLALIAALMTSAAQPAAQQLEHGVPAGAGSGKATGVPLPPAYVVGAADVLSIVFWRDKDMSADVTVRPDGMISLPLLNDISATGLTPEQLRAKLTEAASKFIQDPDVSVVVKEIHSRTVYITGNVAKPGAYPLYGDMAVLQLIAIGGGVLEYADTKNIVVNRVENGKQQFLTFNYKDVISRKRTADNILLKPGDTVVVP